MISNACAPFGSGNGGRPPTERELEGLIKQFIREEILYREAIAMGLDQNDTVIRRRLAQRMEWSPKIPPCAMAASIAG